MSVSREQFLKFYTEVIDETKKHIALIPKRQEEIQIQIKEFEAAINITENTIYKGEIDFGIAERSYKDWRANAQLKFDSDTARLHQLKRTLEDLSTAAEHETARIAILEIEGPKMADILGLE